MSDIQKVPLPAPDMDMVRHIYGLQGLSVPDAAITVRNQPGSNTPLSRLEEIARRLKLEGVPHGVAGQRECWGPADIEARERITREVLAEYYEAPDNDTARLVLPQPTTEPQARDVLRAAVATLKEAEQGVTSANEAMYRVEVRVQELSDQISDIGPLEREIGAFNVDAFKRGLDDDNLPPSLQAKLSNREKLMARFTAAQGVLDQLKQEQRQQQSIAVQAKLACSQAALAVMNMGVEVLATELEEHEFLCQQLRTQLLSFARVWIPGQTGPRAVHVSARVVHLINEPVLQVTDADPAVVQDWKTLHEKLMQDADVLLEL